MRLFKGGFVLKAEFGNGLSPILVPSGRMLGLGDGLTARLGLSLPLETAVRRVKDL